MADRPKLLYIIVQDHDIGNTEKSSCSSFRYTRPILQSALQLTGCKARHAFKISKLVFEILKDQILASASLPSHKHFSDSEVDIVTKCSHDDIEEAANDNEIRLKEITKRLFTFDKKSCTARLNREEFMDVVCDAMSEYRYVGPNQRSDLFLACRIREKRTSMTIMLCGTSGCGKSTLSTLLATRLGITTVVSTDSIRHMMRSFVDKMENPLLWASTYYAGELLDPVVVAKGKAIRRARKMQQNVMDSQIENSQASMALSEFLGKEDGFSKYPGEHFSMIDRVIKQKTSLAHEGDASVDLAELLGSKEMAVQGYKAQSEMVIDSLDRLITSWEEKCESVVVEGVHLSLNFVMGLMKKHPSIVPFMVYIASEEKHIERFSVRAKYMTIDPTKNRYVKYIRNIRAIQDYLCKRADKYLIPKVSNTNVDKTVAAIHATIFGCLRRREGGESFYDQPTNTVKVIAEEFKKQCVANALSSKGMLQVIRQKGSSCRLMALVNTDGSLAKAWPFETANMAKKSSMNCSEGENTSMYVKEPLEGSHVNLHFGKFGLSAWPDDMEGTSHNGSIHGLSSRANGTDCSSSLWQAAKKETVNEVIASGSEEEQEEQAIDADSEEEQIYGRKQLEEELEGSVDDQSIRSDEGDDEVAADQEDNLAEDLGTSECRNRNKFNVSAEDGWQSHKPYHQDPASANFGWPLKDIDIVPHTGVLTAHSMVTGREVNGKHLQGWTRSLPFSGKDGLLSTTLFV